MNVVYIVDFPVVGNSGKQKATREKSKALRQNNRIDEFTFITDKPRRSLFSKVFGKLIFDISTSLKLLPLKNFIVVQRVIFMPITRTLLFIKKVSVISEYHADLKEEIPLMNKSKLRKLLLYIAVYFYNLNYKLSTGIIYNHPVLKTKFDPIYKNPSIYSYNGSNHKEYYPLDMNTARNALNVESNGTIFLFLGSVSMWHGVEYLIDIFNEQIIRNSDNLWLYIVGAPVNPYTDGLKSKSKNTNIIFVPPVDKDNANLYINASDFCLLPVNQIRSSPGSPIKLYDYIACGKPVITQNNLIGYSDEVLKYNLGFTVDFTNCKAATYNITSITENYSLKDKNYYADNNRAISINEVSWTKRMENWCEFINKFSNRSKKIL